MAERPLTSVIIELQSLRSDGSLFEIICRLVFRQDSFPIIIRIDENTYHNLSKCFVFEDNCRYRLSGNIKWDPVRQCHYSEISKIQAEKRETYTFECSEEYGNILIQLQEDQQGLTPIQGSSQSDDQSATVANTKKRLLPLSGLQALIGLGLMVCLLLFGSAFVYANNIGVRADQASANGDLPAVMDQGGWNHFGWGPIQEGNLDAKPVGSYSQWSEEIEPAEYLNDAPLKEPGSVSPGVQVDVIAGLPKGFVALTFDDGPSIFTKEIIDILIEHEVEGTFFFIGMHALLLPEAVEYAASKGMAVGNHSWSHKDLSTAPKHYQVQEIKDTNELLESLAKQPIRLLRPPYGRFDSDLLDIIRDEQMKLVLWNRDPKDWLGVDAEVIMQYVLDREPSGGIYLLHENGSTLSALPAMIDYFKEKNLEIVALR